MKKTTETGRGAGRGRKAGSGRTGPERILVGVRIEPRLVKVMKALAELHDVALGELIERVFWHSMEGGNAFAEKGKLTVETRNRITSLKEVYGVNYDITDLARPKKSE